MNRKYWDSVAKRMAASSGYHLDRVMADHKRRVHVALLEGWCENLEGARILNTDLFEEAFGPDQIVIDWPGKERGATLFGTDISLEIARSSRDRATGEGGAILVSAGDARSLPFRRATFRYVYSSSTLDHFDSKDELFLGVGEAIRVLEPGGFLILTLDNPRTFFYPVVRWLGARGLFGFCLGETVTDADLRKHLDRWGAEVVECRAIYHVHRLVYTAILRAVRLFRLGFLVGPIGRHFEKLEGRQKGSGEFRTGWYTAWKVEKRERQSGEGMEL